MMNLVGSLGLSPAPEDDRIKILNSIMRYLGVSCWCSILFAVRSQIDHLFSQIAYKGLPSWTGMYLVPTKVTL